jgi:hypothetical protein
LPSSVLLRYRSAGKVSFGWLFTVHGIGLSSRRGATDRVDALFLPSLQRHFLTTQRLMHRLLQLESAAISSTLAADAAGNVYVVDQANISSVLKLPAGPTTPV